MRKILYGFMGLVMTASVVAGTAYALFSDTATVSGISINAASADLKLAISSDSPFEDNLDLSSILGNLTGIYPGWTEEASLYMRNDSSGEFGLNVTARLTHADGWGDSELRNHILLKVENMNDGGSTEFQSLAWWNADQRDLPGQLDAGESDELKVTVKLAEGAPEGIQNASLTNITFQLVGTQIVEEEPTPEPNPEPEPELED